MCVVLFIKRSEKTEENVDEEMEMMMKQYMNMNHKRIEDKEMCETIKFKIHRRRRKCEKREKNVVSRCSKLKD